jgi:DNA-binding HxlR family transcriptional regulator
MNLTSAEIIHFNELKLLVSGISSTLLAGRLSELEREELVKKIYIQPRVRLSYYTQSTELVILIELGRWDTEWKGAKSSPKLTAKNVKNIVPLILSIWNKKLVSIMNRLLLVMSWIETKNALYYLISVSMRLNMKQRWEIQSNEHTSLTSSRLQLLYAIVLHLKLACVLNSE